jgi:hypothetical protein
VKRHPQDLTRGLLGRRRRLRELDAARLAAAARVDLGLHDDDARTERSRRLFGFGRCRGDAALGDRDAELAQHFLGLEFVDVHGWISSIERIFCPSVGGSSFLDFNMADAVSSILGVLAGRDATRRPLRGPPGCRECRDGLLRAGRSRRRLVGGEQRSWRAGVYI